MADALDSGHEQIPGTPGIREVRSEMGSQNMGFCNEQNGGKPGTRKVSLRAEIDTSPPFGSVKEAVTRFGGSGSWMPYYYRIGENLEGMEEMDIKKVEEQAAELEKHLIVKELETLDVLEELGTTKRVVEELKQQLQKEAMRCMALPDEKMCSPAIKEMNKENYSFQVSNCEQRLGSLSPCPTSSPELILMELKQAKLNLGKTINDLGVIQSSVESLNKKMKMEKTFLEKTRERLTSKFAGVLSLEEPKQARAGPQIADRVGTMYSAEQVKKVAEAEADNTAIPKSALANEQARSNLRTAELRLLAARKMEEAARAAEAVALEEIKGLSSNETSSGYILPEPKKVAGYEARSPLTPNAHKGGEIAKKMEVAKVQKHEANVTKMSILKKLREATEEVKLSKQALEDALNKVELANRKQLAVEQALWKWMPEDVQEGQPAYYTTSFSNFHVHQSDHQQDSPTTQPKNTNLVNDDPKPVLRSTVSMRDVLNRKQILPEEYATTRGTENHTERQKVALSQMLHELREDITYRPRAEKDGTEQKQYYAQRRKFGFIHISLPMAKQSKKKMQGLNNIIHQTGQ